MVNVAVRVKRLVKLLVGLIQPQAETFPQTAAAVTQLKTVSDIECVVHKRKRFSATARKTRLPPDETAGKVWRQRHYRLKQKYDATLAALDRHRRTKTIGGRFSEE